MPFIKTTTNISISPNSQENLRKRYVDIINLIPGKGSWLMTGFATIPLSFKDETFPAAFVEVQLFGTKDKETYDSLTAAVTSIISEELDIHPERIYIAYYSTPYWGWIGINFEKKE